MRSSLTLTLLMTAVVFGCGGSSVGSPSTGSSSGASTAGARACSPLDAMAQSITLAHVIGAGRHADGTVYVLDDGVPGYRAFVSQGTVLQRKDVSGSGGLGGAPGAESISASVRDATAPFALQIERSNGVATRMGVFRGELQAKSFEIGMQGDELTLVGADVLAAFELRNLPGDIVVEYDATTQDGHRLVVTRPMVDWSYEDFRVFYGTADQMNERHLANASRGSTTYISFDLDGAQYTAIFPSRLSPSYEKATLGVGMSLGPGSQPLTLVNAGGAGLTFYCF